LRGFVVTPVIMSV